MNKKQWVVYLARCADSSLYCGTTTDINQRIQAHNNGTGAKYTRSRGPVKLVAKSKPLTKSQAFRLEHQIKKLPADQKIDALLKSSPSK